MIVESNSILKFIKPDLYLMILDPATKDFKTYAQEFLDRADAVILRDQKGSPLGASLAQACSRTPSRPDASPAVSNPANRRIRKGQRRTNYRWRDGRPRPTG